MRTYEIESRTKNGASIVIKRAKKYKADQAIGTARAIKNELDELALYRKLYKEEKNQTYKKYIEEILDNIVRYIDELRIYERISTYKTVD